MAPAACSGGERNDITQFEGITAGHIVADKG